VSQDHSHKLTVIGEVHVGGRIHPASVVLDLCEFDQLSQYEAREAIRARLRASFLDGIGGVYICYIDTIDALLAERRVK